MVTENAFAILRTDQQLQSPIHDFALCFQARELLCLANQGFVDIDISAGHEVTIHQFRWNWCIAAGFQKQYLIPFVFAATVSAETAAQTKVGLADIQRAVLLTDEGKTALEALKEMDQKVLAFRQSAESAQADYNRENNETLARFIKKMAPVLDKYAKDNGFNMILDAQFWPARRSCILRACGPRGVQLSGKSIFRLF